MHAPTRAMTRCLHLGLVLLLGLAALGARAAAVPVLQVHDAIGPASAHFIIRGIARAAAAGVPLAVIKLDTPGGLDTSMRDIIQAILASRPGLVLVIPGVQQMVRVDLRVVTMDVKPQDVISRDNVSVTQVAGDRASTIVPLLDLLGSLMGRAADPGAGRAFQAPAAGTQA